MRRSLHASLPSLLTFSSLVCAFSAVVAALHDDLVVAGVFILLGYVFDALDGAVARRLDVASAFGLQLDSLVDMVTFGVAPCVLVYQYLHDLAFSPAIVWGACAAYLAGGAFRLARFNLLPPKQSGDESTGLTISTSGATVTLAVLANITYDHHLVPTSLFPVFLAVLTFLMASRIRYPEVGAFFKVRWLAVAGLGCAAMLSFRYSPQLVWFGLSSSYVSFGLARAVYALLR